MLVLDALLLMLAAELLPGDIRVDSFGDALLASLVMAAASIVLAVLLGTNDDETYTLRVIRRIARRQGIIERSDRPGLILLEIDGLALPVLRRALRDGSAPAMARWVAEDGYRLAEWETDLSSQTGASQAGILLGSNEDIPAFRWVEKERGRMMVCSSPEDCAEIERRHSARPGLLAERRRQPRQPALGRRGGRDPDGEPARGREEGQPRLPRLPRQRQQRHAHARAVLLRGRARVDGGAARRAARRAADGATGAARIRSCGPRCA